MPKSSQPIPPSKGELEQHCSVHGDHCPFAEELHKCQEELVALHAFVRMDELTGLFNYRHFVHSLDVEMERVRRSGLSLSLIMMDVDHFKEFNDRWGHESGNIALKQLARTVQATVRRSDIPCRYGGEEFAILLPDTVITDAVRLAERLRSNISEISLTIEGEQISLSASFGVDAFSENENLDATRFIARADSYLYAAKEAGRNCVRHAPSRLETHVSNEERDLLLGG